MNKLDKDYQLLLQDILDNGVKKTDRTGTGTISVFGRQIRHNMRDGFPLLTTKKMAFKTMVTELLWFLRGDTNIKYLVDNDCHIWDGDAYKRYVNSPEVKIPYSKKDFINKIKTDKEWEDKWGELGPIYGKQWRSWSIPKIDSISLETVIDTLIEVGNGTTDEHLYEEASRLIKERDRNQPIDQIQNLINDLKTNPDSRRLMVNAWNVGELDQMTLPPCHYGFQVYTRELSFDERLNIYNKTDVPGNLTSVSTLTTEMDYKNIPKRAISLMWNQRSVDTFLGLPFNIASYGLLLEIIAISVNMVPDEFIWNLGDTHLYSNHIEQAKEQLTRKPYKLPTLRHLKTDEFYKSLGDDLSLITHLDNTDFVIENYQSHPAIKAPLSN
jgi:thymidylate synthase